MNSQHRIPEQFLRNNKPIPLFEVDGKIVKVCLLPANKAEEWAEVARGIAEMDDNLRFLGARVEQAQAARNKIRLGQDDTESETEKWSAIVSTNIAALRALQSEKHAQIKARLVDYDASVFTPGLFEKATTIQLVSAFLKLWWYTDPFVVGTALQQEVAAEILTEQNTRMKS